MQKPLVQIYTLDILLSEIASVEQNSTDCGSYPVLKFDFDSGKRLKMLN